MTIELKYRILNVFTAGGVRLSGNPLCVFEDGSQLDAHAMQALARQMNLSESTFILPSKRAAALVRIFTPAYEMPFAGHPTLGTAHVCRALGLGGDQLGLEMRAGIIPVTSQGDHWTLRAAPSTTRLVESPAGKLGLAVCYDMRFPELFRVMSRQGAEMFVVPSAFTVPTGRAHWEALLRARAIENLCGLIAPAQWGVHPSGRETFGDSMIIDHWGKVLARMPGGTGCVVADIDPAARIDARTRFPALEHRVIYNT